NSNPYDYTLAFSKIEDGLQVQLIGAGFSNEFKVSLHDEMTYEPKTIKQYSNKVEIGKVEIKEYGKEGKKITVYRYIFHNNHEDEKINMAEDDYKPIHKIELHSVEGSNGVGSNKDVEQDPTDQSNGDSPTGAETDTPGEKSGHLDNDKNNSDDELWEDP